MGRQVGPRATLQNETNNPPGRGWLVSRCCAGGGVCQPGRETARGRCQSGPDSGIALSHFQSSSLQNDFWCSRPVRQRYPCNLKEQENGRVRRQANPRRSAVGNAERLKLRMWHSPFPSLRRSKTNVLPGEMAKLQPRFDAFRETNSSTERLSLRSTFSTASHLGSTCPPKCIR